MFSSIITGYKNLVSFTAYYFSTVLLIKTFFTPWRRMVWRKKSRGFDIGEVFYIALSNITSRVIGIFLRILMILFGVLAIAIMMIFALPIAMIFLLIKPDLSIFKGGKLFSIRPLAGDWHYGYTPTLDNYSEDLYLRKLKTRFIDRVDETKSILSILNQKEFPNLFLIGEPGSGRTALLIHIAQIMVDHRFLVFDYVSFLKDKKNKEEEEGAFEALFAEAQAAGNVVLIFGKFEEFNKRSSVLESFLENSNFHIIGVTNQASYDGDILPNESLMQYFSVVNIEELDKSYINELLINRLHENYHLALPDGIIDQLLAASFDLISLESKHQPEAAIEILDGFISGYGKNITSDENTQTLVEEFLGRRLKVPAGAVGKDEKEKLKNLENILRQTIISQDEAISEISSALKRKRLELSEDQKPIGSFLFVGPSGVGKTETAKALAAVFFEDEEKFIRIDMSRFQSTTQIQDLINELAGIIRKEPYGVLLLDEFEKAHKEIVNLFLTIFDEGYFVDMNENKVQCNNLIIIATSNAGSEFIREELISGRSDFRDRLTNYILEKNIFAPELLNRFDAVVCFNPLNEAALKKIANIKLSQLNQRLESKTGKTIQITDQLLQTIVNESKKEEFGAREIDRTIRRLVEDKIADQMLS